MYELLMNASVCCNFENVRINEVIGILYITICYVILTVINY